MYHLPLQPAVADDLAAKWNHIQRARTIADVWLPPRRNRPCGIDMFNGIKDNCTPFFSNLSLFLHSKKQCGA
jgi:hypothetical protein